MNCGEYQTGSILKRINIIDDLQFFIESLSEIKPFSH